MSDTPARSASESSGVASSPSPEKPARAARPARRRPPRPGPRTILLSAANAYGPSLAFARTRGGIAFWRSTSPAKTPLEHVTTFPGAFGVRAVARLLASGAVGPSVDEKSVAGAWIDGVDEDEADLLRLAWSRVDGRLDPRAAVVLALSPKTLARACEHVGTGDVDDLLALGQRILDANQEWIEKHRKDVDGEVDRRAAATAAGEQGRRAIRAFVEECLVTLGRLPRHDETAEAWDGAGLAGRDLGDREARRLGLHQSGRSGKFHVWVRYWDGAGSIGRGDFGSGAGWYWDVTNPSPLWLVDGIMGPCRSAADAWEDAACLAEQE